MAFLRFALWAVLATSALAFMSIPSSSRLSLRHLHPISALTKRSDSIRSATIKLRANEASLDDKTAGALAAASLVATPIVFWSEFTLKTTGCGLPAGPGGSLGAIEGISYLWVVGLVGFSIFTKIKTGKGLPNGPAGLLGAAEGLAYLAILAGIVVLGFQIVDYGYIPNAVPVEGGKCS